MQKKLKRQRAKQLTRDKVLDMAERVFIKTDFKASTLNIAKNASVAHGTIFFHFKNRDELILSVVRRLVLTVTEKLYVAYVDSENLEGFLAAHFQVMRTHWRLIKALLSGFSDFNEDVKQEVIALLAVANYYLVESFNRWADKGLIRTTAWQGTIVYLSFFGDYMFENDNLSENFIQRMMTFMSETGQPGTGKLADHPGPKKLCQSCGMILHDTADFAQHDKSSRYCRYCADDQGTLKSFDQVVKTMTEFFQKTQVLNARSARKAALAVLAKNPAWKEYRTTKRINKEL
jgi:AcrR family transcriptional regulator